MKKLALLCLSCSVSSSLLAQDFIRPTAAGSIAPRTGAAASVEQTEFANPGAPLETLGYEQIRQLYHVQTFTTPSGARANVAALAGSIVEMQGDVSGSMSSSKGRVFIMKIDGALPSFAVSPKFRNFDVMGSGNKARVLVEVGDDASFSLVAATPALAAYGEDGNSNAAGGSATLRTNGGATVTADTGRDGINLEDFQGPNSDVIVMPPMTTMTTPQGARPVITAPSPQVFSSGTPLHGNVLSSRGSISGTIVGRTGSRSGSLPPATTSSSARLQSLIDDQKPAYRDLIRRHNSRLSDQQVDEIATALLSAGIQHNIDPRFLAAVVSVESSFDVKSTSNSGAQGLGQLMPFKSRELGIADPYNPTQNIHGMAKTLRMHLDTFSRFGARGPLLAVAAYNAGPNAVKRAGNNVPAGAQVQRYVWKVYYRYKEFAPDMFK